MKQRVRLGGFLRLTYATKSPFRINDVVFLHKSWSMPLFQSSDFVFGGIRK